MSNKSPIIGALEIGTATIKLVIGTFVGGQLTILGHAECPSIGISKGAIVDFDGAKECIRQTILSAGESSGSRIGRVFLAQTGAHLDGFYNEASVNLTASDNCVSAMAIDRVCRRAMAKKLPNGRAVVHHIRRPFRLDGRLLADPEHLVGQSLEVGYWTVHGSEAKIGDHIHIITGFNLRVDELILSSLAAGAIVTSPEERQNGVLVFDIGCGTTDYVRYHDGVAYQTGVVPVGGDHFTNDLSLGLRLPRRQAEKIKLRFGRCTVKTSEEARPVWLNTDLSMGAHPFPIQTVEGIISTRVREIFEIVKTRLGEAFVPERTAAGIVITGGTSKLPGVTELAANVFDVPARLGGPPSSVIEPLRDPSYSTVVGLFHYKDQGARGIAD